jgi:hypothetical protein
LQKNFPGSSLQVVGGNARPKAWWQLW